MAKLAFNTQRKLNCATDVLLNHLKNLVSVHTLVAFAIIGTIDCYISGRLQHKISLIIVIVSLLGKILMIKSLTAN